MANINLINLHLFFEGEIIENFYLNLEYRFLSKDSIKELFKRNDEYLLNLFFPLNPIDNKLDKKSIKKYVIGGDLFFKDIDYLQGNQWLLN